MAKIRLLDEITINQIAAGEVIENPSSVVKELVENAIDSGATEIHIETKGGGRGLVKVVDNGCGMESDDLLLALERHATSKLHAAHELHSLTTLGFRGEALPSIASVSKLNVHSAAVEGRGHLLAIEGGRVGKIFPYPRRQGTTIEVKSLFFNVPVRKKFQKSVGQDTGEITKVITYFALSYPLVSFSWMHDEKLQFNFLANDPWEERLRVLLGEEWMANSLPIERSQNKLALRGRISRPNYHRPNRTGQYLFINGRAVISPFVAAKILKGYATRLSPHRYPLFVLHLHLPPSWIDVNVHPQKKEVRLKSEPEIASFLMEAISRSLEKKEAVPIHTLPRVVFPDGLTDDHWIVSESEPVYQAPLFEQKPLLKPSIRILTKLGIFFFVQTEEGICVIDGARARERVIFDHLHVEKERKASQSLLLPIQLTVTGKEKLLLCEHLERLNEKGIGIRHFGQDTFVIDAIPPLLETSEISDFIFSYLKEGKLPQDMSQCLKRGEISLEAAQALIEKLWQCQDREYTPNGKLIHYLLDENSLRKLLS